MTAPKSSWLSPVMVGVIVLAAFLILGGIGAVVYVASAAVNTTREAEEGRGRVAAQAKAKEAQARLEAAFKESEAKQRALLEQMAAAKDPATREALRKMLEADRRARPGHSARPGCNCTPGDPLCTCQ